MQRRRACGSVKRWLTYPLARVVQNQIPVPLHAGFASKNSRRPDPAENGDYFNKSCRILEILSG